MKNLLSAVFTLLFVAFTSLGQAKTLSQEKINHELPDSGKCRKWQLGLNVFGISASTPVVICCVPQNMNWPPLSCFEISGRSDGALQAYILLSDFGPEGQELLKKGTVTDIIITKSDTNEINGKPYSVKIGTYKVLENDKKERFLEVVLEPAK